jgi:DNA-binding NarL/FixJ family response regulator
MTTPIIKVAIIEDQAAVRKSVAVLLDGAAGFQCAGAYPSAEAALQGMPHCWPDVVLADIKLPKMSGIECVAGLKKLNPQLDILMFTVYEQSEEIFESLKAGANGYLTKETPFAELLEAIADVHRSGSPMSCHIARKVIQYFQKMGPAAHVTKDLSERELEVLNLLAQGCLYKEIASLLSISVLTVRSHLRRIYEKLHVRSRTEAAVKFLGAAPRR